MYNVFMTELMKLVKDIQKKLNCLDIDSQTYSLDFSFPFCFESLKMALERLYGHLECMEKYGIKPLSKPNEILEQARQKFDGIAEELGLKNEDDVIALIKDYRDNISVKKVVSETPIPRHCEETST